MQMVEDWRDYWDLTDSDDFGAKVYFQKVNDRTEENNFLIDNNRLSGSLAISNNKTFRWL